MDLAVRSIQPDVEKDSQRRPVVHRPDPRRNPVLGSESLCKKTGLLLNGWPNNNLVRVHDELLEVTLCCSYFASRLPKFDEYIGDNPRPGTRDFF